MLEKTDDEHMITMPEIKTVLESYGVTADRKSLYDDIDQLRLFGLDIIGEKIDRNYYYHVGKKQFEIAVLKLLVDAIQSSKFITEKKSNALYEKHISKSHPQSVLRIMATYLNNSNVGVSDTNSIKRIVDEMGPLSKEDNRLLNELKMKNDSQ